MSSPTIQGGYLQIDETPVKVMDPEVKGECARGYLWFYAIPDGDVYLDFQDTDVLRRLPSTDITRIGELIPEQWKPPVPASD